MYPVRMLCISIGNISLDWCIKSTSARTRSFVVCVLCCNSMEVAAGKCRGHSTRSDIVPRTRVSDGRTPGRSTEAEIVIVIIAIINCNWCRRKQLPLLFCQRMRCCYVPPHSIASLPSSYCVGDLFVVHILCRDVLSLISYSNLSPPSLFFFSTLYLSIPNTQYHYHSLLNNK